MPLSREEISRVVRLQLDSFREKMLKKNVEMEFSEELVGLLTEKSYIPEFGARPVKRAIDDCIVNALSMKLLSGEIDRTKPIRVSMEHFPRGEHASDGVFYCCLVCIESVGPMEPEEQRHARVVWEHDVFASVDRRSVRVARSSPGACRR